MRRVARIEGIQSTSLKTFLVANLKVSTGDKFINKVHLGTGHEDPEGVGMYSFALSSTCALDGVVGQRHAPATFPRDRPSTHCTRGWVGIRVGLDGCGEYRPNRDLISRPSSL
jgi:hypothetical protein